MNYQTNNKLLIDGLRLAADFLEARPDFPPMGQQALRLSCYTGGKELLVKAARQLGSFDKRFSDYYFELHKPINEALDIEVYINREEVCKKIVTWDCGDTVESLLKLVAAPETPEERETLDRAECERVGEQQVEL